MKNSKNLNEIKRYRVQVFGVVQGVGFRPYAYNQAIYFNLKGWVSNKGSSLGMDIEGERNHIKEFLIKTIKTPPSLAIIEKIKVQPDEYIGYKDFRIINSSDCNMELKFIGGDMATCPDCLREIYDPSNRRHHYPFTNCTACGPRYSIIKKLPYDRKNTTMDMFEMCPTCEEEYTDPSNRRFHAQPNCCPDCGPALSLLNREKRPVHKDDPIGATIELLKQGKIVAVKGLGGFHLVCDATNEGTIALLRRRKNRPHKPFALMVKDIETARRLCCINDVEERILLSNKRPIVILDKNKNTTLPPNIAPNIKKLGIMLPYTPLHHLLFQRGISYLIMTSGNRSSAPIQYENDEAIENLKDIADYFLIHNRDIQIPVEDSVVKVVNGQEIVVRRARGYTPYIFSIKTRQEILALGAEEKANFCISQNEYGYLSQYLGDLKDFDAYRTYVKAIKNLEQLLGAKSKVFVSDLHQGFLSYHYGEDQQGKKIGVQHHHAHMVSCMVEHKLFSPVIGVVFDGTGLGLDKNIWGGEFFIGTRKDFQRVGHLKYVKIQGGDKAIKEPWRTALSYLYAMGLDIKSVIKDLDEDQIRIVKKALARNINCFESSSIGRLFDCVAALLNLCLKTTYEPQAAIELENMLDSSIKEDYGEDIEEEKIYQISYDSIIRGVLKDIEQELPPATISAKFHNTIGRVTIGIVTRIRKEKGISDVVLSGGVFENNYLLTYITKGLEEQDFTVYYHQKIPTNDGGISVGQLGIAEALEEEQKLRRK